VNGRVRFSLLLTSAFAVVGQQASLTVDGAVSRTTATHPAVRSSMEQVAAATAGNNLARTSFLPRADFAGQLNRATHNNVFGLLLPQSVISSMSGPVSDLAPALASRR
jgi:outer membrane protein